MFSVFVFGLQIFTRYFTNYSFVDLLRFLFVETRHVLLRWLLWIDGKIYNLYPRLPPG